MSIGMKTINRIRDIEALAKQHGLRFAMPSDMSNRPEDVIALCLIDDEYPIYWRHELMVGTLDQIANTLYGMTWMKEYLIKIEATSPEIIKRKEQNVRNKKLMDSIKDGD
jgi:hypothetical protein